jgi:hypothetical protein
MIFKDGPKLLKHRIAKTAGAGLMLALWVLMGVLSASPELHHWVHADSNAAQHDCIVTQLTKGGALGGLSGKVALICPYSPHQLPVCDESQPFSFFDYRVSLSRGPPSIFPPHFVDGWSRV